MILDGADTPVRDLTRWNRAGLDRVRYVDGAAAEWLEYLRICHLLLYARSDAVSDALSDDPESWRAAFRDGAFQDGTAVDVAASALRSAWPRSRMAGAPPPQATYAERLRAQYDHIPLDQTGQISRAFARALHILTETLDAYANEGLLATATQEMHLRRLLEMIAFRPVPPASSTGPSTDSWVALRSRTG